MTAKALAAYVGITEQNLSLLRTGKVKGVRFSTLEKICEALDCSPGDLIDYDSASSSSKYLSSKPISLEP